MAMAGPKGQERKLESQGSSSSSWNEPDGLHLNEPLPVPKPPRFLHPPTATVQEKKPRVRHAPPLPVGELPRIVVPPPPPVPEDPPTPLPKSPLNPLLARARSKRKTIMERIEGWWDLGLLDKRQTLFANGSRKG